MWGWTGRNGTGAGGAATRDGTGGASKRKKEVEGWAADLRKGGRRRGAEASKGLKRPDGQTTERGTYMRGWATLLLSCLLLGFEMCKVQYVRT